MRSRLVYFIFGFLLATGLATAYFAFFDSEQLTYFEGSRVETVFSPGSLNEIQGFLLSAEDSVDIELYQFSNPNLKQTLADLAANGVVVRVILESRVDDNVKTASFLESNGIQVKWASMDYSNTHSKTAVVDGKKVLVGSINWSVRAVTTNRESAVIIEDESIAKEFLSVFEEDWSKANG